MACPQPCFNPGSTRGSGATSRVRTPCPRAAVSILARPEDRALHDIIVYSSLYLHVSILARPEDRALRTRIRCVPRAYPCFNPRPTRRSGATCKIDCALSPRRKTFQSSPDPKIGRYASCCYPSRKIRRFNPRPTRRSGASVHCRRPSFALTCSSLAANLLASCRKPLLQEFGSRACTLRTNELREARSRVGFACRLRSAHPGRYPYVPRSQTTKGSSKST